MSKKVNAEQNDSENEKSNQPKKSNVIGAYDAKTRLPEILRQVSEGQSFTVTNRGHAVADITPTYAAQSKRAQIAINNILNMDKPIVSDHALNELKMEGRK